MPTEAHDVAADAPGATTVVDPAGDSELWDLLTADGSGLCEPTGAGFLAAVEEDVGLRVSP